jgi:hypothetical protein
VEQLFCHIIDKTPKLVWLETDWLWSRFNRQRRRAACNDQLFVEEAAWDSLENPAKDLIGGMRLGRTEFVDRVKSTFLSKTGAMEKHHALAEQGRTRQKTNN